MIAKLLTSWIICFQNGFGTGKQCVGFLQIRLGPLDAELSRIAKDQAHLQVLFPVNFDPQRH